MLFLTGHTLKDADYTIEYHRGELLTDAEMDGLGRAIAQTRRPSEALDADAGAVLAAMEAEGGL